MPAAEGGDCLDTGRPVVASLVAPRGHGGGQPPGVKGRTTKGLTAQSSRELGYLQQRGQHRLHGERQFRLGMPEDVDPSESRSWTPEAKVTLVTFVVGGLLTAIIQASDITWITNRNWLMAACAVGIVLVLVAAGIVGGSILSPTQRWIAGGVLAVLAAGFVLLGVRTERLALPPGEQKSQTHHFPAQYGGPVHVAVKADTARAGGRHVVLIEWGAWCRIVTLEHVSEQGEKLVFSKADATTSVPLTISVTPPATLIPDTGDGGGGINIDKGWKHC